MFGKEIVQKFYNIRTPFYYYDIEKLRTNVDLINNAAKKYRYNLHYAVKANANTRILKIISSFGLGADCVSGNEIKKSVECGFSPNSILFAGVGKTDEEILLGLDNKIFAFNCESLPEIKVINELAASREKTARIALRINPDVNPHTHKYITTGLQENKFGINLWELSEVIDKINRLNNLDLCGLHFHIGSQITDLTVFKNLCNRINDMQRWFADRNIRISHINVGGGLGVDYNQPDNCEPDLNAFFNIFHRFLELKQGQSLHFEPGRVLVASCGDIISRVIYVKRGVNAQFVILDAGMTELIRPALYQAHHRIENLSKYAIDLNDNQLYDVVGPICESSDCFGKAISLPVTERGDMVAIRTTGAYGETMSSSYNLRSKAVAVYSDEF